MGNSDCALLAIMAILECAAPRRFAGRSFHREDAAKLIGTHTGVARAGVRPNRGTSRRGGARQLYPAQHGPFDLDLIFAPDGIERFEDAWRRRVDVEGFPVCHIDDIIASKAATNRQKDRESLPRLRSFREYWMGQKRR